MFGVWCGQTQARQLRSTTAFVTDMTEVWRGEFQKGIRKFKDGNYESALLFFTGVSIHTSHTRWHNWMMHIRRQSRQEQTSTVYMTRGQLHTRSLAS